MILELAEKAVEDNKARMALTDEMVRHFISIASQGGSPPEVLSHLWGGIYARAAGVADPMAEIKHNSTQLALQLLPRLREIVANAPAPFDAAVCLATAGNIIDYGINRDLDLSKVEESILSILSQPYDKEAVHFLKQRMDEARSILYMLDNCGEAVIDRLLMEPYKEKLIVGVRGKPVLNDVTPADALESGIDFAPVIDTGDGTAGVSFTRSSKDFLEKLNSVDLVIAKGQGNFESMEHLFKRPVFYLLRAKCEVITALLNCPFNSIQIIPRNF
jgi:uncharacterized protein with ATP-grasp and redox domains